MTRRTAAAVRPPTGPASGIVHLALHRLPSGDIRTRYEREFTAELYGLSASRQLRHAVGVLTSVTALRHAVHDYDPTAWETAMTLARPSKPWGCRLGLRHRWEKRSTEDGTRYLACAHCNKEHPGTSRANYPMLGG